MSLNAANVKSEKIKYVALARKVIIKKSTGPVDLPTTLHNWGNALLRTVESSYFLCKIY